MTPPGAQVLVAEHEPEVAEMARRYLERAGLDVLQVSTPEEAVAGIGRGSVSLVVLDLTMPGLDIGKVRRAVASAAGMPVLFLVDNHGNAPRGLGVAAPGKRQWITRPFSPRALVAAAAALIRPARPAPVLTAAGLTLDGARRMVASGGRDIALTPTEVIILGALMSPPGRVLSRDRLLAALTQARGKTPSARAVDVYVTQLRAKLGDAAAIRTVRHVGYVIDA